jgi:hypothetical protein
MRFGSSRTSVYLLVWYGSGDTGKDDNKIVYRSMLPTAPPRFLAVGKKNFSVPGVLIDLRILSRYTVRYRNTDNNQINTSGSENESYVPQACGILQYYKYGVLRMQLE